VHHVALSPLSRDSVTAMVHEQLSAQADSQFCLACADLTGGNPLHVRELLAAARYERLSGSNQEVAVLRQIAPAAVSASVQARLARMGSGAIALAEALAVLGSHTEVSTAAELAGSSPAAAELVADELAAAQIIAPARPPHSESSANHPVAGPAQQLRGLVHLINGDQHDVAVEAGRDPDRQIAGCERRHDGSQHAGRVRRVRLVAIPQRHPSVVGRILASHASSAVRAAHDREHLAVTGDLDVPYRALQYVSTLQHPQRLMISDRHQHIIAHRSRLMTSVIGQFVSGTPSSSRMSVA
jgi:hypothetical protein